MRTEDVNQVRGLPLLAGVGEAPLARLLAGAFLQRFPAQVVLINEADPADFLHVVVDGQVEVFSAHRDRETTVDVLGPGKSFIVAAVVLDKPYLKSARTIAPSRILMLPALAVREISAVDCAFSNALAIEMALAYRAVVKELKNQKLRSNLERLANWLLAQREDANDRGVIQLPFEKKILAAKLGMAPEVLSRSFAALAPYHVAVDGNRIKIGDVAALRSLAHPCVTIDDAAV